MLSIGPRLGACLKAQYTPPTPTRLNCRRRRRCVLDIRAMSYKSYKYTGIGLCDLYLPDKPIPARRNTNKAILTWDAGDHTHTHTLTSNSSRTSHVSHTRNGACARRDYSATSSMFYLGLEQRATVEAYATVHIGDGPLIDSTSYFYFSTRMFPWE